MSTHVLTNPRRGGLVASLLAAAAVLAGCSASDAPANEFVGDTAEIQRIDIGNNGTDTRLTEYGTDAAYADADYSVAEAPEATQQSTTDRSVIITGTLYMTVDDPIAAADRAAAIVRNAGGRIDARSETTPDEQYGGSAFLTLRIPSDQLDAVIDDLRELGTVDQFSTDSYDVTVEVTDLEAQISTLRASTARIESLLLEAEDLSDIIMLENELDYRQARLESLEAQQRGLDDQVSMSTIDLSLTTEPVVIIEEPDDSPDTFWDALVSGWNTLVGFLSGVLVVIGILLPWIALLAVIALAVIIPIRARKSRIASRKSRTAPTKSRTALAKTAAARK